MLNQSYCVWTTAKNTEITTIVVQTARGVCAHPR